MTCWSYRFLCGARSEAAKRQPCCLWALAASTPGRGKEDALRVSSESLRGWGTEAYLDAELKL